MKWKGNFWRRLMSKHAVLRRRSRRRQFSLVASDFLYCVKLCDEDDISPCFLSWLTVFSCYICQIDLWSWSCTVHIRCTWPATACLRNKPTYHSHKFTSVILLNKKKKKKKSGAINELLVDSNDRSQVLLFTCIVYVQYNDRPSRVSPFSLCMCVRTLHKAGPCVW